MLRTLILLAATLAVVALAAPTPTSHHAAKRWDFGFSFGAGASTKHSFKSSTRGHRGHRDPRTELSRVYSKFHWSIELPWSNTVWDFDFPSAGGSDQSYGLQDAGSSSGSSDSSYGTSDGSSSADVSSDGSPDGSVGSSPSVVPEPAQTSAATPDTHATESYAPVVPSSVAVDATSVGFATSAYATAAASATASASSDDDGTGEVTATPEENESEYLSPVTIGGQKLNLNFDTGSADLWVFSTSLPASQLGEHSAFDPSKSSTWKELEGASWDISYGDGSGASGTVGYDTVDVGGATATSQAVELATTISKAFVADENNDGLLGLAFGKINTVTPTKQKCFFENIADQLEEQLFTADLDVDASGTYEFGKLDKSKYQGELHTTPIDNSRGFWEFPSNSYSIGGKDVQSSTGSPAIADTGTSLVMVDDEVAEAFYSQIQGAEMNSQAGGYVYPCDADVPSFGVAIGDNYMAHINGSDIEYARVSGNTCFGGIQGNGGQGLQIYGAVLLKQYFAVFNFGDLTFGLAQKN